MRRGLLFSVAVALLAALGLWLLVGGTDPLPARFALEDCRHISLRERSSGKLVEGAEDMLMMPDGDTLAVAAIDRSDQTRPFAGLFRVSLFDLEQGGDEVEVSTLVPTYNVLGGIYPQGIALDPASGDIAIINRIGPETRTVIDVVTWDGDRYASKARYDHKAFCRANDLTFDLGGNLLITRDRARCELSVVDMIPFHPSGLLLTITPQGEIIASKERYYFPNGIALGPTGKPIIAETRAGRLSGGYVEALLPGGPDNLTVDDQGALIAAVHPSLWTLFRYLNSLAFSSPSRVIRADPERSDIEVLFDDPGGDVLSAVSVGLMRDGKLYMGSVADEGIAVCEKR